MAKKEITVYVVSKDSDSYPYFKILGVFVNEQQAIKIAKEHHFDWIIGKYISKIILGKEY